MDIGHRIRTLRARAKLSQKKLAELAHTSRETIAAMEQGRHCNPTLDTLREIATACHAAMSDLFPGNSRIKFDDHGIEEHADLIRRLRFVLSKTQRSENILRAAIDAAYKEVEKEREI